MTVHEHEEFAEAQAQQRQLDELRRQLSLVSSAVLAMLTGVAILRLRLRRSGRVLPTANTPKTLSDDNRQTILDAIPDLMFEVGLDGRCLDFYAPCLGMPGAPTEHISGKVVSDILPPDVADTCLSALREAHESGMSKGRQFELMLPHGKFWFELFVVPKSPVGGDPRFIVISRDITERRRTEDALSFIAQGGWKACSQHFFDALVRYLGKTLDVDYVVIDRLGDDRRVAETVALYAKGAIVPNLRYELGGTPCENVMGRKYCCYPQDVQKLFPADALLTEMGAESYAGLPLWDSAGHPIGLIAVLDSKPLRDQGGISRLLQLVAIRAAAELERERSENAVQEREQAFRSLAENSPDCIIRYDHSARIRYVNGRLARELSVGAETLIGKLPSEIWPDGRFSETERAAKHAIETGVASTIELSDGMGGPEPRFHHILVVPEKDAVGNIVGALAFGRDITDQRAGEHRLKLSQARLRILAARQKREQQYRGLFNGTNEAVQLAELVFDDAGRPADILVHDVNPAYEQHTGLRREHVVGRRMKEILPGFNDAWLGRYAGMIASGKPTHFEKYSKSLDRWFEVYANPMGGNKFAAIMSDISQRHKADDELKSAKAEAERANNAKSRFLAAASHDLRQPLAALNVYVSLLKGRLSAEDRGLLSDVEGCVGSLSDLLSKLLDLSKLEAGAVAPQVRDFDLDRIFDRIHAAHGPEANAKGLELRRTYAGLIARTDPILFQRIIGNLVANAIRYTDQGGVLIGCRRWQGRMWVEVWDTGIGIPADKTFEVFEEFKQLGNQDRDPAKGSGLGLSIVAKTAALLHLQVRLKSHPGKGSVFAIELPLGQQSRSTIHSRLRGGRHSARIALVDDDAVVLSAMARALAQAGHDVIAAATGEELSARLGGHAPDIMVCDYRLDGETGFDVIAKARRMFDTALPAIVVTADTDDNLIRAMAEKGIAVRHKPVDVDGLLTQIEKVVARFRHVPQTVDAPSLEKSHESGRVAL